MTNAPPRDDDDGAASLSDEQFDPALAGRADTWLDVLCAFNLFRLRCRRAHSNRSLPRAKAPHPRCLARDTSRGRASHARGRPAPTAPG
eukprot:6832137-Prymnesium_polylepis.1